MHTFRPECCRCGSETVDINDQDNTIAALEKTENRKHHLDGVDLVARCAQPDERHQALVENAQLLWHTSRVIDSTSCVRHLLKMPGWVRRCTCQGVPPLSWWVRWHRILQVLVPLYTVANSVPC